MPKEKPVCEAGPRWLRTVSLESPEKIRLTQPCKTPLAALTGQDFQAYQTFLHALQLWAYCDDDGRKHAILCMRHAIDAMQPHTRWVARASIPHLLDWSDQDTMWQTITEGQ